MNRKYSLNFNAEKFAETGHIEITDDISGESVTLEKAKELAYSNDLKDCSLSFSRLCQFDFDIDALRAYYLEN